MCMNMKKLIILASAVAGLFMASSCGKMLEVTPPNSLKNGTEDQKEQILGQIAAGLSQYLNYWNIPNVGTDALAPSTYCMQGIEWMRGLQGNDIAIGRDANTNGLCGKAFYENTFGFSNANESTNKAHWYVNDQIINKANFVLFYMTKDMAKTSSLYAQKRAAALMIRAYGYMGLLEEYTQPYSYYTDPNAENTGVSIYENYDPGQKPVKRSSVKASWDFVKEDLKEAIALTKEMGFTNNWQNGELEDFDYGLANFLYMRACLLTGDWDNVITAGNSIVGSNKFSFIAAENWGGHNTGESMDADKLEFLPENNAFTALKKNPECIFGYNVLSTNNPHVESALCAHFTRLANPFGYYASSTCARIDDRLYNKIADDDCRKAAWWPAEIVNFKYLNQTPATVASYGALKFAATYGLDETSGDKHTTKDAAVGINEFCKFRYSEVVLMIAEAYAQKNDANGAKAALNPLIKARTADKYDFDSYPSHAGLSALQKVQLQYRIEMWGENGREYYNNKRWGISVNRSDSNVHIAKGVKIEPKEMTCQIIEEEIRNNPECVQNNF